VSNEIEIRVISKDQTSAGFASADANARKLAKSVDGGAGSAGAAYESATKKANGFHDSLRRVGEIAAGVLAANMLQAGARRAKTLIDSTVEAASSLGESINAVQKVYGTASAQVLQWGKDNANAIGLSTRAFNQMATPLGSMLKNQGLSLDEVTDHTIKLTQRAADLASVFNTDVTDALGAIQAGLRGEQDPLERYGVSLSAVAVEARALADSHKTSAAQLTSQEKALARLNIIYDQTKDSAGDFAGTANGLANAQRVATATIEDAKAKIGTVFIPVMAKAAQVSGAFAGALGKVPTPVLLVGAAVAGLGAALLLLAPRVVAARTALREMSTSTNIAERGLAKAAVTAGKAGAALGVLSLAGGLIGSLIQHDLNPQIEALSDSLVEWAKNNQLVGESLRIIGDGQGDLDRILAAAGTGFSSVTDKISDFAIGLLDLDSPLDDSRAKLAAIDDALTALTNNGKGEDAAAIFEKLKTRAADMNISVDELKAALPEYAAAAAVAGKKTADLGATAATAAPKIDDLTASFDKLFHKTFDLEEAQDKAADAVQRLRDQIKQQRDDHDKGATSLTGNTQAARDNRSAVRDLVQQYEDVAVKLQAAGKNTSGLQKQLENQLVSMGLARSEAHKYTTQLGDMGKALDALPDNVPVKVIVTVAEDWTAQHHADRGNIIVPKQPSTSGKSKSGSYSGHAYGGITGAETVMVSAAASGGQQGGWTMVGERGPELARLPYGSTVYPTGQSMQMLAKAGGGEVRHIIDLRLNGRTIREFGIDDAVQRGISREVINAAWP
jgi:predicted  nucleic acid-binding Zn-ribbon protein